MNNSFNHRTPVCVRVYNNNTIRYNIFPNFRKQTGYYNNIMLVIVHVRLTCSGNDTKFVYNTLYRLHWVWPRV